MKPGPITDPFQLVVDMQLQSISGFIEASRIPLRSRYRGVSTESHSGSAIQRPAPNYLGRKEHLENLLIWAYDRKYHRPYSQREAVVSELLAQGFTHREIGRMLRIGKGTVHRIQQRLQHMEETR